MLQGQEIVCLSAVDWEGIYARPQHLMSRFAGENRVLYVEPPVTLLSPLKDPSLWSRWGKWLAGPRQIHANLLLWSPPVMLPFGSRLRIVNRLNQALLGYSLRRVLRQIGFSVPVLLTYLPNTCDLTGKLEEKLLVYDCVDEHAAFPGFNPRVVREMEDELLQQADVAFASARKLFEPRQAKTRRLSFIPNAAEVEHYRPAAEHLLPAPPEMQVMRAPVIGFIGGIHAGVDLETVRFMAERHPEWTVVLIGPAISDTSFVSHLPNVHLLGGRSYASLPAYLQQFAVATIPYYVSELTVNVNPLKLYEYLAAGKPVVSTALPEIEPFAEVVYLARNREEFVVQVERALAEDSPERQVARIRVAEENSWDARYREMALSIADTLQEKVAGAQGQCCRITE